MSIFISCDWGTSNLRLRLVDAEKKIVLREIETADGIASVYRSWQASNKEIKRADFYLSVLNVQIENWKDTIGFRTTEIPVIISGMASSSIGLTELEYKALPVRADGTDLLVKKIDESKSLFHPVYIVSGVRTEDDVLRGEETLLAGCNTVPGKTELFIFPGTHSKHIRVSDGKAETFSTYMTGELFELLSKQSILSSSVGNGQEFNPGYFEKGIMDGAAKNFLNSIFQVRIHHLFERADPEENFHYLSGLIIGCELGEITGSDIELITIVASDEMIEKYVLGLERLGYNAKINSVNSSDAILAGHCKMFWFLIESGNQISPPHKNSTP